MGKVNRAPSAPRHPGLVRTAAEGGRSHPGHRGPNLARPSSPAVLWGGTDRGPLRPRPRRRLELQGEWGQGPPLPSALGSETRRNAGGAFGLALVDALKDGTPGPPTAGKGGTPNPEARRGRWLWAPEVRDKGCGSPW